MSIFGIGKGKDLSTQETGINQTQGEGITSINTLTTQAKADVSTTINSMDMLQNTIAKGHLDTTGKQSLSQDITNGGIFFYETPDRDLFIQQAIKNAFIYCLQQKQNVSIKILGLDFNKAPNDIATDTEKKSFFEQGKILIEYSNRQLSGLKESNAAILSQEFSKFMEDIYKDINLSEISLKEPFRELNTIKKNLGKNQEKEIFVIPDFDLSLARGNNSGELQGFIHSLRSIKQSNKSEAIIFQGDFIENEDLKSFSQTIEKRIYGFPGKSDIKIELEKVLDSYEVEFNENIKDIFLSDIKAIHFIELNLVLRKIIQEIQVRNIENNESEIKQVIRKIQAEKLETLGFEIIYPGDKTENNIPYLGNQWIINFINDIKSKMHKGVSLNKTLSHLVMGPPGNGKSRLIEKEITNILGVPIAKWNPTGNSSFLGEMEKRIFETMNALAENGDIIIYFPEVNTIPFFKENSHESYQSVRGSIQELWQDVRDDSNKYPNVGFIAASNSLHGIGGAILDRFKPLILTLDEDKEVKAQITKEFLEEIIISISNLLELRLQEKNISNITIKIKDSSTMEQEKAAIDICLNLFGRTYTEDIFKKLEGDTFEVIENLQGGETIFLKEAIFNFIISNKNYFSSIGKRNEEISNAMKQWAKDNNFEAVINNTLGGKENIFNNFIKNNG